jgi:hypothetical protein
MRLAVISRKAAINSASTGRAKARQQHGALRDRFPRRRVGNAFKQISGQGGLHSLRRRER